MKKGTIGRKVGPLKSINGIHADGSSLKLKVLVGAFSLAVQNAVAVAW